MRHLLILFLFAVCSLNGWQPLAVYTLLENHPEERMAIQWITTDEQTSSYLVFSEEAANEWYKVKGTKQVLPGPHTLYVHRVVLEGLKPDTTYLFQLKRVGEAYRFKTLPNTPNAPVSFVVGGDIYHDTIDIVRKMNKVAAGKHPHFALLGGDIAYTASKASFLPGKLLYWSEEVLAKLHLRQSRRVRWIEWIRAWSDDMITQDGNKIPLFTTIGNHDVDGGFHQTKEEAKMFYLLFVGDSPTVYRTVDIGTALSIIALDSGHTAPIGGTQSGWLYHTLRDRRDVQHKFAFYHVPAYPSVRNYQYKQSAAVRQHWVPLFEAFGIRAAFEHHDHAYKRTVPIRNGKEDPNGVVYFGDGAWGVKKPRKPKSDRWYIAESAQKRNIIHVEVESSKVTYQAVDDENTVIDSISNDFEVPLLREPSRLH